MPAAFIEEAHLTYVTGYHGGKIDSPENSFGTFDNTN